MCRSVSGFICVHLLEPILHMYSAWFSRKVLVMHALEESVVVSFVPQLLAACLLLHVYLMIIFWSHALTLVRPSCCLFRDAYPQEHAALLLRRARLLSCICTRKMVPLLFRTSQPVMCLSVSGFICVHLLEHTQVLRAFTLFAVIYPQETCCVICCSAQLDLPVFYLCGSSVIISLNKTGSSRSLLLSCMSRRNCCLVCCSGELDLPVF